MLEECINVLKLINKNSIILDIGTGSGIVPILCRKLNVNVYSIDDVSKSSNVALENIKKFGVNTANVDISKNPLPFESNFFDLVFLGDVIEHLPDSPTFPLNEIYRVLKPKKYFICSTPNAVRLSVRIKMLFGKSNWYPLAKYIDSEGNYGHHHEYTMDELIFAMTKSKFTIFKAYYFESKMYLSNEYGYIKKFFLLFYILMTGINSRLKSSLFIICTKK